MNQINMIGNLTDDVEVQVSQGGTSYCQFNIGVQRPFKDKQSGEYMSDFPRCKAFGKTAEIISEHFRKGSKIGITGSLQTGQYEDKDGKTIFTTDIMVNQVTFVERKNTNQGQQSNNNYQNNGNGNNQRYGPPVGGETKGQAKPQQQGVEPNPFENSDGPVDISDDDLPF